MELMICVPHETSKGSVMQVCMYNMVWNTLQIVFVDKFPQVFILKRTWGSLSCCLPIHS